MELKLNKSFDSHSAVFEGVKVCDKMENLNLGSSSHKIKVPVKRMFRRMLKVFELVNTINCKADTT